MYNKDIHLLHNICGAYDFKYLANNKVYLRYNNPITPTISQKLLSNVTHVVNDILRFCSLTNF